MDRDPCTNTWRCRTLNEQLMDLHRRNQIMSGILWGCMALGVATAIDTPQIVRALLIFGLPIALLCTVLTWRKVAVRSIQYIIAAGIGIVVFFFLNVAVLVSDLFILFLSLAIISIYHNYRPLLLNGVLMLVILNYYLFTKEAYAGVDIVGINTFLVLVFAALVAQSWIGINMRRKIEESAAQSEEARRKTNDILREVTASVEVLGESTSAMQSDAASTGNITKEVVQAFQEIAVGIEQQANSIRDISESMQDVAQTVEQTVAASANMSETSRNTSDITERGRAHMAKLAEEMRGINAFAEHSARMMQEVNQENEKIGDIVHAIIDIANRTNLLALNASIEAARAGEHGQGFSVVATEIRKLAQSAHDASQEIAGNLGSIQAKIAEAANLVQDGVEAAASGRRTADEVERLFDQIRGNAEDVLRQAEELRRRNEQLLAASAQVSEETGKAAAISEQSAASVQEVLASAEEQLRRVDNIVGSIDQLTGLAAKLENLVKA